MEKRADHLQWCKDRANEYVEQNDLPQAFATFMSDMDKHPDTSNHMALKMGTMMLMGGHLNSQDGMRYWINGFN